MLPLNRYSQRGSKGFDQREKRAVVTQSGTSTCRGHVRERSRGNIQTATNSSGTPSTATTGSVLAAGPGPKGRIDQRPIRHRGDSRGWTRHHSCHTAIRESDPSGPTASRTSRRNQHDPRLCRNHAPVVSAPCGSGVRKLVGQVAFSRQTCSWVSPTPTYVNPAGQQSMPSRSTPP